MTLTNGKQSPIFQSGGVQNYYGTLKFNVNSLAPVKEYEFGYRDSFLNGLRFIYSNNKKVFFSECSKKCNYYDWQGPQSIPESEEIIGVYGVKDEKNLYKRITSLGFITKKREVEI